MASQDNELSKDMSFFLNLSSDSTLLTSTPKKVGRRQRPSPFKRPLPAGPVLAKCSKCGKEYRTLKYFKKHMENHALKEIAYRLPANIETLLESAHQIGAKVLHIMKNKPSVGCYSNSNTELLQQIETVKDSDEWQDLVKFVCGQFEGVISKELFCMPSSLIQSSMKVVDNILTNSEITQKLFKDVANHHPDKPSIVITTFWAEFVFTFADELLIFLIHSLREATVQNVPPVTFDQSERECIYYIGGSICNGFKRMSYKYPNSKKWANILEVIQSKFLEEKLPEDLSEQEKKDRKWTENKNRGGLMFIRGTAQTFFLALAQEVRLSEDEKTGSLPVEEIIKKVVGGAAKYDWDSLVGSAIDEELSFSLMTGIVKSFVSTYGKGVIKRRMNALNSKKASVSLALRQKVVPR